MCSLKLIIKIFLLIVANNLNLVLTVAEWKNRITFNHSCYKLIKFNGSLVSSGGLKDKIGIWDIEKGIITKYLTGVKSNLLMCLADGSLVSADRTIRILDEKTGATKIELLGHTSQVSSLVELPDGTLASSADTTIRRWDVNKGITIKEFNKLNGHFRTISSLVRLLDGSLASGSFDNTIKIWKIESGETIKTLLGHTGFIFSLVVLFDGSLASGSWDNTIRIWDVTQGVAIKILKGHAAIVGQLVVLYDGLLASGSWDYTIRIWDVTQGTAIKILKGHTSYVSSLIVLSYDQLASCSGREIIIWERESSFPFRQVAFQKALEKTNYDLLKISVIIIIVTLTIVIVTISYIYYSIYIKNFMFLINFSKKFFIFLILKFVTKERSQSLIQQQFQNRKNHCFHLFH